MQRAVRLCAVLVITAGVYVPMVVGQSAQAACGVWR
jgi:hypothetical protein